jgi:DNA-binding winged helix-turn-helix (wHTH) protein
MTVTFGDFTFSADTRQLFRHGTEVHLSPKAFDLLRLLLDARPKALSKTDLMERLWPGTFVSDASVSVLVAQVRGVLGDQPRSARFIRTIQRYGYAFCGEVTDAGSAPSGSGSSGPAAWLLTGTTRMPLSQGTNIIGRDPRAAVPLNLPGISRQHARIVIDHDGASVTDLGSKNGTLVRGERITSTVNVRDGDHIRIGPLLFTVRLLPPQGTTQTETMGDPALPGRRR